MSRHAIAVLLVPLTLVSASADAAAQRLPPRLSTSARPATWQGPAAPDASVAWPVELRAHPEVGLVQAPVVVPPRRPAHAARYVAVGAAVGATATAGAIVYYFRAHPGRECICSPVVFAPVVLGGAAVGAAAGAVVYAVRRR